MIFLRNVLIYYYNENDKLDSIIIISYIINTCDTTIKYQFLIISNKIM